MTNRIIQGDCLATMAGLPDNSVDAVVTDPPAGIGFMGKAWDGDKGGRKQWTAWMESVMVECLRVLKPGGHVLVWAIPRTSHWTGWALENAGFEVRDVVTHIFATGFPKSLDVSKAIDRAAGAEREVVGSKMGQPGYSETLGKGGLYGGGFGGNGDGIEECKITAPSTPEAKQWDGWGTALKPATEMWWLARKPLGGRTVAANVLEYGTGAINVDGCRIGHGDPETHTTRTAPRFNDNAGYRADDKPNEATIASANPAGRFPANLILDPEAGKLLDEQSGVLSSGAITPHDGNISDGVYGLGHTKQSVNKFAASTGGASRYFYCAKSSRRERNAGLDGLDNTEIVMVEYTSWENEEQQVRLRVDTVQSPPKVIGVSGVPSASVTEWNTWLFGNRSTGQSPPGSTFTISTASPSITESKTLSWLHRYNTNESIADVNGETELNTNPAANAEPSTPYLLITNAKMESLHGVANVASGTQLKISVSGGRDGMGTSNSHPT